MKERGLYRSIIERLPYHAPFLFVESLETVRSNYIEGTYLFKEDEFFYTGHFVDNPVTPGVILLECMGQIGLVSQVIFLTRIYSSNEGFQIQLCDLKAEFFKPVLPNTRVTVKGTVKSFRAGKLRSQIRMEETETGRLLAVSEGSCLIKIDGP